MINIVYIPHLGSNRPIEGRRWENGLRWGGDFMLENIMKNISPKFKITPRYSFDFEDFDNIDIIHLHNIATSAIERKFFLLKDSKIRDFVKFDDRPAFIGGVRGVEGFERSKKFLRYFNAIHVGSSYLLQKVRPYNKSVYICNAGVDTSLFRPLRRTDEEFCIGWVGDAKKKVKNYHLLGLLDHPVKTATKENYIPHEQMPEFYSSISVYVNLSAHEGFCRPIVEAAACGLPVVSTNVGIASELLSPEWIIEGDPNQEDVLTNVKRKMQLLKQDPDLRESVGRRNRKSALRWDWKNVVKQFEKMFEETLLGNS